MGSSGLGALLSDQQQRLSDELKQRRAALSVAALSSARYPQMCASLKQL